MKSEAEPMDDVMIVGMLLAAAGVALGAFGSHGLDASIGAKALGWWQTAVQYQMWHAIGIVALAATGQRRFRTAGWLLAAGALIFSGTLYLMALGGSRWLGAVTPLGGAAMIAGWLLAADRAIRR